MASKKSIFLFVISILVAFGSSSVASSRVLSSGVVPHSSSLSLSSSSNEFSNFTSLLIDAATLMGFILLFGAIFLLLAIYFASGWNNFANAISPNLRLGLVVLFIEFWARHFLHSHVSAGLAVLDRVQVQTSVALVALTLYQLARHLHHSSDRLISWCSDIHVFYAYVTTWAALWQRSILLHSTFILATSLATFTGTLVACVHICYDFHMGTSVTTSLTF